MWHLRMALKPDKIWEDVGYFETLTAAAQRIIELDEATTAGVFFEFHVLCSVPAPDAECLSEFQHTGRKALFYLKQRRH